MQAYHAAGSAIRMDGTSVAAPGYESVPSNYMPFNWQEYDIEHSYAPLFDPTRAFINRAVRTVKRWSYHEHNGFIYIKDENFILRIAPIDKIM